jgi:hypothetical protein
MNIAGKGNNFRPGVQHHTAQPVFANRACEKLQTVHIVRPQSGGSFNLDSRDFPRAILQDHVNFLPRGRAPKEDFRLRCAPCRLFAEFHDREVLQKRTGQVSFLLHPVDRRSQQVRQLSRIVQINLGSLDHALSEVPEPGTEQLHQEHRLE